MKLVKVALGTTGGHCATVCGNSVGAPSCPMLAGFGDQQLSALIDSAIATRVRVTNFFDFNSLAIAGVGNRE